MTDLTEAVAELAAYLPVLEALLPEKPCDGPGQLGTAAHSAPPWDPETAAVVTDIHAGARAHEAGLALEVTGRARKRGGSGANTLAALERLAVYAEALPRTDPAARAAHQAVLRWTGRARQLPGVGEEEKWQKIRAAEWGERGLPPLCHFCGLPQLQVRPVARLVMCFYADRDLELDCPGARRDDEGHRYPATATIDYSHEGRAFLLWHDGTVQWAPE